MGKGIVVVGSSNTDMIIQAARIPRPGETILGGDFSMAAGGKGANQAVAAARAGGSVTFVARVGNDIFGQKAIDGFKADGINVQHVIKDAEAPSGVALIFVAKDGENSIGVASGANSRLSPADVEQAKAVIEAADVLIMQLETPLDTIATAAKIAAARGVRVILNPAPAQKLTDQILKHVSIITPNETEAELLTGIKVEGEKGAEQAAKALMANGIQTVLVTLGARGTFVATATESYLVPAFKVDPVDTTAAGDVFNGTLAVALSEGKPLRDAVCFANAAGALSVTKLGAQPSAPTRKEVDTFITARP